MAITPEGTFANAAYNSIKAAEALQGLAVAHIAESFAVQKDEELDLTKMTWEDFVERLQSAHDNDATDAFNDALRKALTPIVQGMIAPQPNREQDVSPS